MTLFATGGEIAANPGEDARSRQRAERIVFPVQQEAAQVGGPSRVVLLGQEFELAQEVLVTQRVQGVVLVVGLPVVRHQPGVAVGQHAQGVHGLGAPVGMHAVEGQVRRAGHVQPMQAAGHPQTALIEMHDG